MKIAELLKRQSNNSEIAIKESKCQISYSELHNKALLISNIVGQYDNYNTNTVGVIIDNSINYAAVYFGILYANKTVTPFNPKLKSKELECEIEYCECKLVFTTSRYFNKTYETLVNSLFKGSIINIETFESVDLSLDDINRVNNQCDDLLDIPVLLHTSGTTNSPKRVMLSNSNLIANIESNIESLNLTSDDIVLIALPMYFGYCNTAQFLTHIYLGAKIVINDSLYTPRKFLKIVEQEKITNFTGVPTMLLLLNDYKSTREYNITSLKFICFGGGKMPIEHLKGLMTKYKEIDFIQTYGQTEASPRVTLINYKKDPNRIGSIGKAIPNVKVELEKDNNIINEPNVVGEIVIQGPNVMKGYYKWESQTKKAIRDNKLYSGDLAYYDESFNLYLAGRIKNIIISGGINIYPEEIESVLLEHPSVKSAMVKKQDDHYLGEVPISEIVLEKKEISEKEIIEFCKSKLSDYKVPREIRFVDRIDTTYNGKVKRN